MVEKGEKWSVYYGTMDVLLFNKIVELNFKGGGILGKFNKFLIFHEILSLKINSI